jgi:hypothetical protein
VEGSYLLVADKSQEVSARPGSVFCRAFEFVAVDGYRLHSKPERTLKSFVLTPSQGPLRRNLPVSVDKLELELGLDMLFSNR